MVDRSLFLQAKEPWVRSLAGKEPITLTFFIECVLARRTK